MSLQSLKHDRLVRPESNGDYAEFFVTNAHIDEAFASNAKEF